MLELLSGISSRDGVPNCSVYELEEVRRCEHLIHESYVVSFCQSIVYNGLDSNTS